MLNRIAILFLFALFTLTPLAASAQTVCVDSNPTRIATPTDPVTGPATRAALMEIPYAERMAVLNAILARLDIRCGHTLQISVSRSADGTTYEVAMSYDLGPPTEPSEPSEVHMCADYATVDVNYLGRTPPVCPSPSPGSVRPCGTSLLGVLREISLYGDAATPC